MNNVNAFHDSEMLFIPLDIGYLAALDAGWTGEKERQKKTTGS